MIFEAIQSHAPEKTALQDAARSVCYGDLVKEVDKRAQKLENVSVLGIALDNGVEWVLWDLAALKAGVPCVPLPPFLRRIRFSTCSAVRACLILFLPKG